MLVVLCVLLVSKSYAYTVWNVNGSLVHESESVNIYERFIEDICFLLPSSLTEIILKDKTIKEPTKFDRKAETLHVQPNYEYVIKNSSLSGEEYWKRLGNGWDKGALSKEAFSDYVLTLSKRLRQPEYRNRDEYIIYEFARTVRNIIEVGLRSSEKYDVLNLYLHEATRNYAQFTPDDYIVSYRYNDVDMTTKIDFLYEINSLNDNMCALKGADIINNYIYTELVKVTADIWTQVWSDNQKPETVVFRKVTLRKLKDAKPTFNMSNKLQDYEEMMLYLRRDRRRPGNWKADVIEKRVDDYIYESIRYNNSQRETLLAKQMFNIKNLDDYPEISFGKLMDAIRYQKSFSHHQK